MPQGKICWNLALFVVLTSKAIIKNNCQIVVVFVSLRSVPYLFGSPSSGGIGTDRIIVPGTKVCVATVHKGTTALS